ncbi:glycoside hydrolase family 11 protein [Lophiostoma macrostomum CBS 122681]|uniref:Endo-1,4-beta-xylanase n=1 Tax=Lophiostoma macrostomum CBS 122681 TaxID=1314788 RepID=A0A6A6TBH7_9PLEO|nr:glycoside hydrolase family 11 protein [Lophiostoma macrostomum CBS 122681]
MVAFSQLALALSAVAGAFAAPAADPNADAPDFDLNGDRLMKRQDYNQNYKTSGNVNFSPGSNGYSVTFSGAGDFVVGKGWKTGTTRNITFDGSTTASAGTVLVSVYGWTTNPLIEYYVQEYTSNGAGSAQGQKVGTVTCDGSVYDIWKHQQVSQPSIQGTSTFWQYISNRQTKRPGSGTVTTSCHFDAWKALGLNLGTHNYQTLSTEGWGNAGGNSKYTIS